MIKEVYGTQILIEVVPQEEESVYLLPEDMQGQVAQTAGKVLHIGTKVKDTSIGDVVGFNNYASGRVFFEGIEYIVVKEEDLICKLTILEKVKEDE